MRSDRRCVGTSSSPFWGRSQSVLLLLVCCSRYLYCAPFCRMQHPSRPPTCCGCPGGPVRSALHLRHALTDTPTRRRHQHPQYGIVDRRTCGERSASDAGRYHGRHPPAAHRDGRRPHLQKMGFGTPHPCRSSGALLETGHISFAVLLVGDRLSRKGVCRRQAPACMR